MGKYPEIEEKMEKRINGYAGELKTTVQDVQTRLYLIKLLLITTAQ